MPERTGALWFFTERQRLGRLALCAVALAVGLSQGRGASGPNDYNDASKWLCRPGGKDACSGPVTATVIRAGAPPSQRTFQADANAPIDCFYVYPTVSLEQGGNSDRVAGPEEERAARNQFARFGAVCRLYAPLYRQVTLAGLRAAMRGDTSGVNFGMAYQDVANAWDNYLSRDNHGRGVVLIGHSQGSKILTRLLATEIEGKPVEARLVSAILPGTNIETPVGKSVGGTFQHIPLCQAPSQTGCVVGYSSYLATAPPGADGKFGVASKPGWQYACVNPAALTGGGKLEADLPARGEAAQIFGTTFIENPGMFSAQCRVDAEHSYLAIAIGAGPGSERVAAGLATMQERLPGWGLHALDVNIALGNLVDLVRAQGKAWLAGAHHS